MSKTLQEYKEVFTGLYLSEIEASKDGREAAIKRVDDLLEKSYEMVCLLPTELRAAMAGGAANGK